MNRQFSWDDSSLATQRDDRRRPLPSAQCSLCGIALPTGLMVPDGGQACSDIRWYCKDAKACTERWTANLPRHPHIAPTPTTLAASPPALPPVSSELRSLRDEPAEEAWSADPS